MLIDDLETQLKRPCFENFDDFSAAVLRLDKQDSLRAVTEVGLRCSNLSQAFALAYRCALQALLPQLDERQWAAMCVTERQGNHPKDIQTQVNADGYVSGEKSFVTMAGLAQQLLVIAKQGEQDGRPVLKAVLVDGHQEQVAVTQMPAMGMLKDIPHGALSLKEAKGQALPGDGHEDYSKVFRMLEDAHILLAASCVILNQAYRFELTDTLQKALGLVSLVRGLNLVASPWVHLQLAEGFNQFLVLCEDFEHHMSVCGEDFEQAWHKDKKLFSIASGARKGRTEKAIQQVFKA